MWYREKPGVNTRTKSGLVLSGVGARKSIRSMEINKTAIKADVILTTGNCQTLPHCGKDGVVLGGLRSHDVMMMIIKKNL